MELPITIERCSVIRNGENWVTFKKIKGGQAEGVLEVEHEFGGPTAKDDKTLIDLGKEELHKMISIYMGWPLEKVGSWFSIGGIISVWKWEV